MTAKPITIAGKHYATKGAVEDQLSALLRAGGADGAITDLEDIELLSELFHARDNKVGDLKGRTIVGWGREENAAGQCFAALLNTGERLHFSYPKSLTALYAAKTSAG